MPAAIQLLCCIPGASGRFSGPSERYSCAVLPDALHAQIPSSTAGAGAGAAAAACAAASFSNAPGGASCFGSPVIAIFHRRMSSRPRAWNLYTWH